ncbi:MAG: hypothetical protein ACHQQQ_03800 [Bacteroidota bacterium]
MIGYIFLSDNKTENECLHRLLFGTDPKSFSKSPFQEIRPGDYLFLFNYDQYTIRGPFRALTICSKDIEKDAYKDSHSHGFPYQIRVSDSSIDHPISGDQLPKSLKFSNGFPPFKISDSICNDLIAALAKTSNKEFDINSLSTCATSSHYIFMCDGTTGGRVFHENLFGATAEKFRPIVSKIQEGDILFLWVIEEQKLYGVWKAKSRGQYNPTAFPEAAGRFPAVVYATRYLQVEPGLEESILRSIVPYDSKFPPLSITYEEGNQLLVAFEDLCSGRSTIRETKSIQIGKIRTEDGHWVQSQAEARIDDWLFNHNLTHAYEYRIQSGYKFKKSDFYLPTYQLYIEFWGLMGNLEYEKSREEKLQFYKQNKLKLVELFPRDIEMLSEVIEPKLAAWGVKVIPEKK